MSEFASKKAGWTANTVSQEWGKLDLSGGDNSLPPAGEYPAIISGVSLSDKGDVLWMIVRFKLDGFVHEPAPEMGAIMAKPGSQHSNRVPDGLRLLHRLIEATGVDAGSLVDPEHLIHLFVGQALLLTVGHKLRDGVPELVVRSMRPMA